VTPLTINTVKQAVRLARELKRRRHREATGRFLIEGINFVGDALQCGAAIDCLLMTEKVRQREKGRIILQHALSREIPFFFVKEEILDRLTDTETPQGVLAIAPKPVWDENEAIAAEEALLLALDGIQDPGNLGTIIRSGDGVGVNGIFLGGGTVDIYNPKVLRSTMGSVFRIPAFPKTDLLQLIRKLREKGFFVVAADPRADIKYYQADFRRGRFLIVIGNESRGISPALLELADLKVRIPLKEDVESLNAAVAAALVLFEVLRQRDTIEDLRRIQK